MGRLKRLPDSTAAKWLGFILGVIAAVALVISPGVRNAVTRAYDAKWPLAVALGISLAVVVALLLRRRRAGVQVVRSNESLTRELRDTVQTATKTLYCIGSRSRDKEYLQAIEDQLRANTSLRYVRILCGAPHHHELTDHLAHLAGNEDLSTQVEIRMADLTESNEPEQSICASEERAVIVVPALGPYGRYDSAIVLTEAADVDAVVNHAQELRLVARALEVDAIKKLVPTQTRHATS